MFVQEQKSLSAQLFVDLQYLQYCLRLVVTLLKTLIKFDRKTIQFNKILIKSNRVFVSN